MVDSNRLLGMSLNILIELKNNPVSRTWRTEIDCWTLEMELEFHC